MKKKVIVLSLSLLSLLLVNIALLFPSELKGAEAKDVYCIPNGTKCWNDAGTQYIRDWDRDPNQNP